MGLSGANFMTVGLEWPTVIKQRKEKPSNHSHVSTRKEANVICNESLIISCDNRPVATHFKFINHIFSTNNATSGCHYFHGAVYYTHVLLG